MNILIVKMNNTDRFQGNWKVSETTARTTDVIVGVRNNEIIRVEKVTDYDMMTINDESFERALFGTKPMTTIEIVQAMNLIEDANLLWTGVVKKVGFNK